MKKIIESRALAAVVLVICIIAALVLCPRRSAKALEDDILEAFRSSPEQYVNVRSAMQDISIAAHNFLDAVQSLTGDDEVYGFAVLVALFDEDKDDPFGRFTPSDVQKAAMYLYNDLHGADTPKNDAKYYYNQIKSLTQQLARNEAYADAAHAYNEKIDKFPMNLFDLRPAMLFD